MKFGVIGAGGRLGGKVTAAALDRGIEVTAIVRSTPCPSLMLDADGPCTGDYLTRCDRHILYNEDGNSYASYDDLPGGSAGGPQVWEAPRQAAAGRPEEDLGGLRGHVSRVNGDGNSRYADPDCPALVPLFAYGLGRVHFRGVYGADPSGAAATRCRWSMQWCC